jgi:hypothetical protein
LRYQRGGTINSFTGNQKCTASHVRRKITDLTDGSRSKNYSAGCGKFKSHELLFPFRVSSRIADN